MLTQEEILAELRVWIENRRILQKEVAQELGVAPARVSELLKGARRLQAHEMPVLARLLGMVEADPSVRKIKRIGRVAAGSLREALQDATGTLEVSASLPKGVFAIEVDGESMNRIAPFGCDVIVDPSDKALFAGDLYVLGNEAGEFTFKRFMQEPARLVPLSSDPAHGEIPLGAEPINIVGRVVSISIGAEHLRKIQ